MVKYNVLTMNERFLLNKFLMTQQNFVTWSLEIKCIRVKCSILSAKRMSQQKQCRYKNTELIQLIVYRHKVASAEIYIV